MSRSANTDARRTVRERLRACLEQARDATVDGHARKQIERALALERDLPPTGLEECSVCGRVGLPERIAAHDCP